MSREEKYAEAVDEAVLSRRVARVIEVADAEQEELRAEAKFNADSCKGNQELLAEAREENARLMRDALAEAGAYRREFARAEAAEAERDALRAQVAAVRALAENARKHAGGPYTAQVDALSIERALRGQS